MTKNEKEALKKGFIRQWYHASMLMLDAEKNPNPYMREAAQKSKLRAIGARYLVRDILLASLNENETETWLLISKWIHEAERKAGCRLIL